MENFGGLNNNERKEGGSCLYFMWRQFLKVKLQKTANFRGFIGTTSSTANILSLIHI